MCPKDDPINLTFWLIFFGSSFVFAGGVTFAVSKLKSLRRQRLRNQPIEEATVSFIPAKSE